MVVKRNDDYWNGRVVSDEEIARGNKTPLVQPTQPKPHREQDVMDFWKRARGKKIVVVITLNDSEDLKPISGECIGEGTFDVIVKKNNGKEVLIPKHSIKYLYIEENK